MADPIFKIVIEDDSGGGRQLLDDVLDRTPAPQSSPSAPYTPSSPAAPSSPGPQAQPARAPTAPAAGPPVVPVMPSGKVARPRGTEEAAQQAQAKAASEATAKKAAAVASVATGDNTANLAVSAATGNPIAIAMLVKEGVDKAMTRMGDPFRHAADVAETGGAAIARGASGENAKAISGLGDAAVAASKKLPLIGDAAGVVGENVMRAGKAFSSTIDAIVARGEELKGYSGSLATSYAMTDVRQMMQDIRESQALGPNIARINDAQTELSIFLRQILIPLKDWIFDKLANFMENLVSAAKNGYNLAIEINETLKMLPSLILARITGDGEEIKRITTQLLPGLITKAITDAWKKIDEGQGVDVLDQWLKSIDDRKLGDQGIGQWQKLPEARPPIVLEMGR